jgi:hypothetical protein
MCETDAVSSGRVQHSFVIADHEAERWAKSQRGSQVEGVQTS